MNAVNKKGPDPFSPKWGLTPFGLYGLLWAGLAAVFVWSLDVGPAKIFLWDTVRRSGSDLSFILWDIRLPRTVLGLLAGATLGLAGAAMQGFLRNPLAEPGVLGVAGGAVFGAVFAFYSGLAATFSLALPLGGILGAFLAVLLLYFFAGRLANVQTLILAGVAINVIAFSGTSLALNLTKDPYAVLDVVFWQMGSLADRSFSHVFLALPFILIGWAWLLWDRRALDALSLGEVTAQSLGVDMKILGLRMILGTALCVGAAVAVCGSIGFVGLVVPHLLRPFVSNEPGKLLGVSALGGAILLILSDIAVRLIPSAVELKLGVVTSLIGAPFFILLIFQMRKKLP